MLLGQFSALCILQQTVGDRAIKLLPWLLLWDDCSPPSLHANGWRYGQKRKAQQNTMAAPTISTCLSCFSSHCLVSISLYIIQLSLISLHTLVPSEFRIQILVSPYRKALLMTNSMTCTAHKDPHKARGELKHAGCHLNIGQVNFQIINSIWCCPYTHVQKDYL